MHDQCVIMQTPISPGGTLPRPREEDDGVDLEVDPDFYRMRDTTIFINRTSPILNTLYEELADLHSKVNKNNNYGFKLFALTKRCQELHCKK